MRRPGRQAPVVVAVAVAAGGLLGLIGGRLLLLRGLVLSMPVYRVRGRGRNSGDHCRPADGAEQTPADLVVASRSP